MNELLLLLQTIIICITALLALRNGAYYLCAFIALQAILANLFVLKQITLFGMQATASDAFMVGSMFSLQLLQEYYGKALAQSAVRISFFFLIFYTIMSYIHILYTPSIYDTAHKHFYPLLYPMPRIAVASIFVYTTISYLDTYLFSFLKRLFSGKWFFIRNTLCITIAQLADTVLFSFLGLYGIIENIGEVIIVSFTIKMIVIMISRPILLLAKKLINTHSQKL
jgi:uncharacterized integral membrane protein (TIGR00697 family)